MNAEGFNPDVPLTNKQQLNDFIAMVGQNAEGVLNQFCQLQQQVNAATPTFLTPSFTPILNLQVIDAITQAVYQAHQQLTSTSPPTFVSTFITFKFKKLPDIVEYNDDVNKLNA